MDVLLRVALRIDDAEAREAVCAALAGAGRPAGLMSCAEVDGEIIIDLNDATTPVELVMHLIEIELRRYGVPRHARLIGDLPDATAVRIAAAGLGEPDLTVARLVETYVPVDAA